MAESGRKCEKCDKRTDGLHCVLRPGEVTLKRWQPHVFGRSQNVAKLARRVRIKTSNLKTA